jgi:hypothetical protein
MNPKEKTEGDFSHSMGVNTRPAHRFKINGYWVLVDGNMPDEDFKKIVEALLEVEL